MAGAARMRGAPPFAARVAAVACTRSGRKDLAILLWEEISRDRDPAIRALARERLQAMRENAAPGPRG
jgi:hypothetical protein